MRLLAGICKYDSMEEHLFFFFFFDVTRLRVHRRLDSMIRILALENNDAS